MSSYNNPSDVLRFALYSTCCVLHCIQLTQQVIYAMISCERRCDVVKSNRDFAA